MDRLRIAILIAVAALGPATRTAVAQTPAPGREVVDRIVAVVGDSAILMSDLEEEVNRILASTGQREQPEDAAVRSELFSSALESRINSMLLLQAAERDSILIPDADVQRQVDQQISQQRLAFGGDVALDQALRAEGLTLAGYRDELTRQVRMQGMIEGYLANVRRSRQPPPLTESRVKKFFDEQKDQLGERPASLNIEMVIVAPKASDEARAAARAEIEELLGRIREGEDFAELARRYSHDQGTKDLGGDLGWQRDGRLVAEFSRVAFALPPGGVSGVVETIYGFHIIKVEKTKGAERQIRHILITPEISDADLASTKTVADEVLDKMRSGTPIDVLVSTYGDPNEPDQGAMGPLPREAIQQTPPFDQALADVEVGDLIGPFALTGRNGERWAVVKVTQVTEQGPYRWEDPDVRAQFRQRLAQQLLMSEIVEELKARTFIDIRL